MVATRREFTAGALLTVAASVAGSARSRAKNHTTAGQLYEGADATALAALVRSGEVSPLELLEEAIRRVEAVNPLINAVSQQHYDEGRAAISAGLPDGPFTGVPFLLKDLGVTLAAGVVPMAHATDGGGSIRVPANHCGVFGFKPSRGLTPGVSGPGMSIGHAVSRTVRDSAALLDASAGYEPGAPWGMQCVTGGFLAATRRDPGPVRIALNMSAPAVAIDPECRAAVADAARLLQQLGHRVEEAAPPLDFERVNIVQNTLLATDVAAGLQQIEKARGRPVRVPEIEPMTAMIRRAANDFSQLEFASALREMQEIGRAMGRFMADYDLVLQPVTATPPPRLGTITYREGDTLLDYTRRFKKVSAFTHLYNMSGQPSMSLPLALSSGGLPIGVMLSGRVGEDALLFSVAAQVERASPWASRFPPVAAPV